MPSILCVDDDPDLLDVLGRTLQRLGHVAHTATGAAQALQVLAAERVDLIISDHEMPGLTGLEFLALLRDSGNDTPLVVLTGHASIRHAVDAMRAGAVDYLTKPVDVTALDLAIGRALELAALRRENAQLRREVDDLRAHGGHAIVGESAPMRRLMETVATVAATRASVLLQGESGTGKELVARALHDQSERRAMPFVQVNCAALPEGLIESALFGHEKGAFTGAVRRVHGAFERAHRGTLLLDEISEMRLDLQAKLLRALQEQEFERVGGAGPIRVDVRVIATTNRDLAAEVSAGRFRQDLYFRLNVVRLVLPPLRERPDDIPRLAMHFARRAAAQLGKTVDGLAPSALARLHAHEWPGNVRELQHAVERAVILAAAPMLEAHDFDDLSALVPRPALGAALAGAGAAPATDEVGLYLPTLRLEDAERALVAEALRRTAQNRTRAARLLGIHVRTLRKKVNEREAPEAPDAAGESGGNGGAGEAERGRLTLS